VLGAPRARHARNRRAHLVVAVLLIAPLGGCGAASKHAPSSSGGPAASAAAAVANKRQLASGSSDPISSLDVLQGKTPPSAINKRCGAFTGSTEAQYATGLAGVRKAFQKATVSADAATRRDAENQLRTAAGVKGILVSSCSDGNSDSVIVYRLFSNQTAQDLAAKPLTTSPASVDDKPEHPWVPLASGGLGDTARCATKPATFTLGGTGFSLRYEACAFALGTFVVAVQQTARGDLGASPASPGAVAQTIAVKAWLEAGAR
jgi:hypothetical protein